MVSGWALQWAPAPGCRLSLFGGHAPQCLQAQSMEFKARTSHMWDGARCPLTTLYFSHATRTSSFRSSLTLPETPSKLETALWSQGDSSGNLLGSRHPSVGLTWYLIWFRNPCPRDLAKCAYWESCSSAPWVPLAVHSHPPQAATLSTLHIARPGGIGLASSGSLWDGQENGHGRSEAEQHCLKDHVLKTALYQPKMYI